VEKKILLLTPPFTQLNTPYPATAYIKGFLETKNIVAAQADLGIATILRLFSKQGLQKMFGSVEKLEYKYDENIRRIFNLRNDYIETIDTVIRFLQDDDPTVAYLICQGHLLPEASRFDALEDVEWAFGTMGIRDQARYLATLFLEDISDFIVDVIDPFFGFSRYAERLGMSANSFDELYGDIQTPISLIGNMMLEELELLCKKNTPNVVCISVPFPGNLFAALHCGKWMKSNYPKCTIVMGGGYPNTELRSLSDARVFEFVDYITLDDGEMPLMQLFSYLDGDIDISMMKRTFSLVDGKVVYHNGSIFPDVKQEVVGTPNYKGLPLRKYLSVIQLTNPMHRLWSDGRWNKLTMAHGCYWGKCTFCDISLDYIANYEASSASVIVDRMEKLIEETGNSGFHFVDEAAPPALMKAVALEILKRQLTVNWWTNIRFEKSFTYDLCRLLAASGCIAVSGGLEVASDRLLSLIAKGVTIEQVAHVNDHFNSAGIMVHAYLMYGFPTQTEQETIDSLEVVRQMFETGIMQSAFWHRFAMTAHSPVGINPSAFQVQKLDEGVGSFANNDLEHEDPTGCDHELYKAGLEKSLYNYMHGVCLDHPLQNWFNHPVPETTHSPVLIASYLEAIPFRVIKSSQRVVWLGGEVRYAENTNLLHIITKKDHLEIKFPSDHGNWLCEIIPSITPKQKRVTNYKTFQQKYVDHGLVDFLIFWHKEEMELLRETGLVII